ncbi:MAG: hypothetical protein ACNYPE_03360 [Candidatus Azotimanducaceae bacterium WSBS_2022_MAG_OTU7]
MVSQNFLIGKAKRLGKSGSSRFACINGLNVTDTDYYATNTNDDCKDNPAGSSSNGGYDTTIGPATGCAVSDGQSFAFACSSNGYRQNDTSEDRGAFFAAFQLQPNEDWDINLDIEISERVQAEQRHDLNFANMKRNTRGVTADALVVSNSCAVLQWAGDTSIESNSEVYSRSEDYEGGGLSVAYNVNDRLTLSADLSYSETTRQELQISLRTQSDNEDIFSEDTAAGLLPRVTWNVDSGLRQYTIEDFDVMERTLFSDEYRIHIDSGDQTRTIVGDE